MAIESFEQPIGSLCPEFSLLSVDGKKYTLEDFQESSALLVAFICNHCPYVKAIEDRLIKLARSFPNKDLQVVGICSNDPTNYPDDSRDSLYKRWKDKNYGFPYLVDDAGVVGKLFNAVCTPDLFLYDGNRALFYHGRLDDSWKDPSLVKNEELKTAVEMLLRGEEPPLVQNPCLGCSIKWKNA